MSREFPTFKTSLRFENSLLLRLPYVSRIPTSERLGNSRLLGNQSPFGNFLFLNSPKSIPNLQKVEIRRSFADFLPETSATSPHIRSVRFVINYEGGILSLVVAGKFEHSTCLGRNTKILSQIGVIFGINNQGWNPHALGKIPGIPPWIIEHCPHTYPFSKTITSKCLGN